MAASVAFLLVVLTFLIIYPAPVSSQSNLQSQQLTKVIEDVLKAESAGARPDEMAKLAAGLNDVLSLENELQTPQDSNKAQPTSQIAVELENVDTQAKQIEIIAAHRTFENQIRTYLLAAFASFLATIIAHYALLLRRRERVKRVLRMKIVAR